MVLPASAPDPVARGDDWLERIAVITRLASQGVIVLVDRARLTRLGDLVRSLVREHPDVEVYASARDLVKAPRGSVVVLVPAEQDPEWLNQERPLIAERELRLILFCDEAMSAALARRAPDFFNWISHRVECPGGPAPHAVREIRKALCKRAPGIEWYGSDLEGAFREALPGRRLVPVSANAPGDELMRALRPLPRTWIRVREAESHWHLGRVLRAMQAVGRRDRIVLENPKDPPLFVFWRVSDGQLSLDDAVGRLAGVVKSPGRMAALADLSDTIVDTLRGDLWARFRASAGGAVAVDDIEVVRAAIDYHDSFFQPQPPMKEGLRRALEWIDSIRILTPEASSNPEGLASEETIREAQWAVTQIERGFGRNHPFVAEALLSLGRMLRASGRLADAEEALRRAVAVWEADPWPVKGVAGARWYLARVLFQRGKLAEAESLFRSLQGEQPRESASDVPRSTDVLEALSDIVRAQGRIAEAEELAREAIALRSREGPPPEPSKE